MKYNVHITVTRKTQDECTCASAATVLRGSDFFSRQTERYTPHSVAALDNQNKGLTDRIKNAHQPSKRRQIDGAKRAQPRVDSINIKYPYTLIISHDLRFVPSLTLQVAQ